MKVITDWIVTPTCLDLFQWFRFEDAVIYLYYNKYCADARKIRYEYDEQTIFDKVVYGIMFNFVLILCILAPVLLFSGMNPVQVTNPIQAGTLSMEFELMNNGKVYSIFDTPAFNINQLEDGDYHAVIDAFTF